MSPSVIQELDRILIGSQNDPMFLFMQNKDDLLYEALALGEDYELFSIHSDNVKIKRVGREVLKAGGFRQWYEGNKKREEDIYQAAMRSATANEATATYTGYYLLATVFLVVFAAISLYYTIADHSSPTQKAAAQSKADTQTLTMPMKPSPQQSQPKSQSQTDQKGD
jgi:hypothetical protein